MLVMTNVGQNYTHWVIYIKLAASVIIIIKDMLWQKKLTIDNIGKEIFK